MPEGAGIEYECRSASKRVNGCKCIAMDKDGADVAIDSSPSGH